MPILLTCVYKNIRKVVGNAALNILLQRKRILRAVFSTAPEREQNPYFAKEMR